MSDWLPFLGVIVVALIGAIPGVLAWRGQQRREAADVAVLYQRMATEQAGEIAALHKCQSEYEARLDQLEVSMAAAEIYIQGLEDYVDELVAVMRAAGLQPTRPKPERKRLA